MLINEWRVDVDCGVHVTDCFDDGHGFGFDRGDDVLVAGVSHDGILRISMSILHFHFHRSTAAASVALETPLLRRGIVGRVDGG